MVYYKEKPQVTTISYENYYNEYWKEVAKIVEMLEERGIPENEYEISYIVYYCGPYGDYFIQLDPESEIASKAADKFESDYYSNCYQPFEKDIKVRNARMQKWWEEANDEELQARLQAERAAEEEARRLEKEKKEQERLAKQEEIQQKHNAIMEKVRAEEEKLRKQVAGIKSSTSNQNSNIYKMFNTLANNLRPGSIGDVQTMANDILSIASES